MTRRILLCEPRGFCAGVDRAIDIIDQLVCSSDETVYVRKEIVHNRHVVEAFKKRGVVFIDDVEEAPESALVVFSAHGISPDVRRRARQRRQRTIDATCPLVTKVHREVHRFVRDGYSVLLIGHAGHEEVEGTLGQVPGSLILVQDEKDAWTVSVPDEQRVAVVTQTTLSLGETREIVAILKARFPLLAEPRHGDICYATENRQGAVRTLAAVCEAVIVVGSANSSNSRSLRAAAEECGTRAYLVDDPAALEIGWFEGVPTLGVTAGASSPEALVQNIIERIRIIEPEYSVIERFGTAEPEIVFRPPPELAEYV